MKSHDLFVHRAQQGWSVLRGGGGFDTPKAELCCVVVVALIYQRLSCASNIDGVTADRTLSLPNTVVLQKINISRQVRARILIKPLGNCRMGKGTRILGELK
jgi:hypothetical protein